MRVSKKYRYQEQFPNRGAWETGLPVTPSYLTIGGSGVISNGDAESPMSNYENSESPTQESAEGASMNSGDGAAAGAAPTYGGSGVA